jgi:hypothetical protein
MKKSSVIIIFAFIVINYNLLAYDLWNGIQSGSTLEDGFAILQMKLKARDITDRYFLNKPRNNDVLYGDLKPKMKNYYNQHMFITNLPSYRQEGEFYNIALYCVQNKIIGIEIEWAVSFDKVLEQAQKEFGEYQIVDQAFLKKYIFQNNDKIIEIYKIFDITEMIIIDKNWYEANIVTEDDKIISDIDSGLVF